MPPNFEDSKVKSIDATSGNRMHNRNVGILSMPILDAATTSIEIGLLAAVHATPKASLSYRKVILQHEQGLLMLLLPQYDGCDGCDR
jgi:hypothetical protein